MSRWPILVAARTSTRTKHPSITGCATDHRAKHARPQRASGDDKPPTLLSPFNYSIGSVSLMCSANTVIR